MMHYCKLAVICLGFLFMVIPVLATDITVTPYEIKFNYEAGHSHDALTISNNGGGAITGPEWAYNNGNPDTCAYIMGQTNRRIQARFGSNCNNMHLFISLTVASGTGIGAVCNYFVPNYNVLDWVTIPLEGNLPSSVGSHSFTWQWSIYALPNNSSYCAATSTFNTNHIYFTVFAEPQAPIQVPWKNIINYACSWANGETDELGVVSKITTGAYNNLGLEYDQNHTQAYYPNFNLTQTLNDGFADCRDMSAIVQVFSNAVGCSNIRVKTIDYDSGSFNYKIIKPIGLP